MEGRKTQHCGHFSWKGAGNQAGDCETDTRRCDPPGRAVETKLLRGSRRFAFALLTFALLQGFFPRPPRATLASGQVNQT